MVLIRRAPARPLIAAGWFPRWLKPLVFLLALSPLLWFVLRLGLLRPGDPVAVNPIETAIRFSGDQALTLLLVSLAVSPLRRLTGWAGVMRLRRMLGLFAFFYAAVHLLIYAGVDQFFDWAVIWADVLKRCYITVGMVAVVILLALAVTSPKGMVRRLGGRWWKRLHALVYLAAPLGVLHYAMMVKADLRTPLLYAGILAVLLLLRLPVPLRR
ncbi:protein-methionine-sulfoxide reductase heme-binding subunit MsrQ [Novispirillum itersonii]|uniref:Protein-methionine-sulfoxide reductase heme-binding subunit MsrQ n=1 Tax=Novispirillum itersonii TaxID=189 RepID=A0A7W9ZDI0_NOVIT|nr:protein-methionine-sulfoxide reductase heme-binding subunit MsrQ [Novispirillum itersonii]MBB6208632.1 sulfoxide reductase heme-binding subunit YedZ [Novispirillum itersonii]